MVFMNSLTTELDPMSIIAAVLLMFIIFTGVAMRRNMRAVEKDRDELRALLVAGIGHVGAEGDEKTHLPVVADPTPKPAAKLICDDCVHWDLEAGQAAMTQNQPFFKAAQVLTPYQMGSTVEYDDAGNALPRKDGRGSGMKASWEELGGCGLRDEGTFRNFTCPNWHHIDAPAPGDGFGEPTPLKEEETPERTVPTEKTVAAMEAREAERLQEAAQLSGAATVAEAFLDPDTKEVNGDDPGPIMREESGG